MTTNKKNLLGQIVLCSTTAVFLGLLWCINLLPFPIKLGCGKCIGLLLYWIPNRRTKITRINIALCFPKMSDSKKESMVRRVFVNFGASMIETAMAWWDPEDKIHRMTETIGIEHLMAAQEKGKGVILIGAHFSTLDLSAKLISSSFQVHAIYRKQTNPVVNWVMTRARERTLLGLIPHTSMRMAAKALRENQIVWYSPDQDMGVENSVFAPFFGHPAATITATSKLAKLSNSPLVMLATYRDASDSGYVVHLLPGPENYPSDDPVKDATAVNALIEQSVMLAPEQYYWFHRRFKTQEGKEKGVLYS